MGSLPILRPKHVDVAFRCTWEEGQGRWKSCRQILKDALGVALSQLVETTTVTRFTRVRSPKVTPKTF